jgi:hypothetical protein
VPGASPAADAVTERFNGVCPDGGLTDSQAVLAAAENAVAAPLLVTDTPCDNGTLPDTALNVRLVGDGVTVSKGEIVPLKLCVPGCRLLSLTRTV